MPGVQVSNNACAVIAGALDDSNTTIVIGAEGAFFPILQAGEWFYGTLSGAEGAGDENQLPEIVKVTGITGPGGGSEYTMTVERGAGIDGAAPKAWEGLSNFQLLVTSELLYDLKESSVADAGATSYILNSESVIGQTSRTLTVGENGYLFGVSTNGLVDTLIQLPPIPAVDTSDPYGLDDVRYVIVNRTPNSDPSTKVTIAADAGETVNSYGQIHLTQQNTAVVLHAKRGDTFWDAMTTYEFGDVPNTGDVYGITYGPSWVKVVENPPDDGNVYVREGDLWVVGVEEAPQDGNQYARSDGTWTVVTTPDPIPVVVASVDSSASQSMPFTNSFAPITFNRSIYNPDGYFDASGVFTAPYYGIYNVEGFFNSRTYNQGGGASIAWSRNRGGVVTTKFIGDTDSAKNTNDIAVNGSSMAYLEPGDTLELMYRVEESGRTIDAGAYFNVVLMVYLPDGDGAPIAMAMGTV